MDDFTFEQWSEMLLELRQSRRDAINDQIKERRKDYTSKELFDYLMVSLDQIMTQWWEHEKRSWESSPPSDVQLAADNLKNELESITDFEIDASLEDLDQARSNLSFNEADIEKGKEDIQTFARDLKKTYLIKIDGLTGGGKSKAPEAAAKTTTQTTRVVHVNKSSGMGLITMFLIGLSLGGGVAYYFIESAKKSEQKLIDERQQLIQEKREFINDLTSLQETYYQLAQGKLLNLPEIEKMMKPIREEGEARKKKVEADFSKTKENLLKRIPAGDRLDRSLEKLEEEKTARFKEISDDIAAKLEPYLKQKQIHEDFMKQQ